MDSATLSPLGKASEYIAQYEPDLLFPIPRQHQRDEIGVSDKLPFKGLDVWNAFEMSWLNAKGKPIVALAEFVFPCESPNLIESKSFKLYLNSFNNTRFAKLTDVIDALVRDLSDASGMHVKVNVTPIHDAPTPQFQTLKGICLDTLDVECHTYTVDASYLKSNKDEIVTEELYSEVLKSNCLVTGQPDWASLQIAYTGPKIDHEGLLKYIVSFRNHNEFHEQCVERIFMDLMRYCAPQKLTVFARYTRRGGLDINPYRSTEKLSLPVNRRGIRQ